jgi:simple sugar transport system substrate-binding protein
MKKFLRVIPVLLLVVGIIVTSFGAVGAQSDQLVFRMVAHGGAGNPFWIVVIKGMEDSCALLDADCAWLADPVDNIDDMAGYWDDALAANPDGMGTTVPNPEVIRDAVLRADEAGIPVIAFNTADPNSGTPDALPIFSTLAHLSSSVAVPTHNVY